MHSAQGVQPLHASPVMHTGISMCDGGPITSAIGGHFVNCGSLRWTVHQGHFPRILHPESLQYRERPPTLLTDSLSCSRLAGTGATPAYPRLPGHSTPCCTPNPPATYPYLKICTHPSPTRTGHFTLISSIYCQSSDTIFIPLFMLVYHHCLHRRCTMHEHP